MGASRIVKVKSLHNAIAAKHWLITNIGPQVPAGGSLIEGEGWSLHWNTRDLCYQFYLSDEHIDEQYLMLFVIGFTA